MLLLILPLLAVLTACSTPDKVEEKPAPTMANKEESLLRIAKATEAAGDTSAALQLYHQIASNNPDSIDAWLGQARLYQKAGKNDMAITALEKALEKDSGNTDILRQLANSLIYTGNAKQALVYLENALENSPDDARLLNTKGIALDMQEKYEQAQASFRKALEQETGSKSYIENNLAMSYLLADEYEKSIALLNKLVATDRDNARFRQNLALAYGLKGDIKKAMKLGLKDLPEDAAEENVDFYKAYSRRIGSLEPSAGKHVNAIVESQDKPVTNSSDPLIADKIPDTPDATYNDDVSPTPADKFAIETD